MKTVEHRVELERVLQAMEPRLRGLALRCLDRASDADDVVQEVCARVLAAADRFRGDAAAATWIYRIATSDPHRRGRPG